QRIDPALIHGGDQAPDELEIDERAPRHFGAGTVAAPPGRLRGVPTAPARSLSTRRCHFAPSLDSRTSAALPQPRDQTAQPQEIALRAEPAHHADCAVRQDRPVAERLTRVDVREMYLDEWKPDAHQCVQQRDARV